MFDDKSQLRHFKDEKRLWKSAAAVERKKLSAWIRDALNKSALEAIREQT